MGAALSWAGPKSHPARLSAGRKESWPQSLGLGNSYGLTNPEPQRRKKVDLKTSRSPGGPEISPPSSQPGMLNKCELISKKKPLHRWTPCSHAKGWCWGARLCHWPSSPIFGNQCWGLLLEKAWPGARGTVLGSVLQKPPHSLGLGFLSYKIRELDCLLSNNIPGLAFSDLLR